MVAGAAPVEGLNADETELVEIKTVDKHVDRTHRIVIGHIVVEHCRE
jgi:hypothetical protein